jgi:hypothetical protein
MNKGGNKWAVQSINLLELVAAQLTNREAQAVAQ